MVAEAIRAEVLEANLGLARHGLVKGTSGNASGRDPASGLIIIKPSGVPYERLEKADLVVVDLDGRVVSTSGMRPSTDTESHLRIYRGDERIGGVVHTHSTYASVWAALGRDIPPIVTFIADEFGGAVPCGNYRSIEGAAIGEEVLRVRGRSRAVLMKSHGVFCLGPNVPTALRSAIAVEEAAKIAWLVEQAGGADPLPPEEIERYFSYHEHGYGQPAREGSER